MKKLRLGEKHDSAFGSRFDDFDYPIDKSVGLAEHIAYGLIDLFRVGVLFQIKPGVPSAGVIHNTPKNLSEGDPADFESCLSQFGCPTRKMLLQIEHQFRWIGEV